MTATRKIGCCLLLLVGAVTGMATTTAEEATQERTSAFEQAYATSFYQFDACGDEVAGRIFRNALVDKLKQCPFSADAKQRFQVRIAAQRRISGAALAKLIEDNGGLPVRLEGMPRSCRQQVESPEYRQVRGRLDDYAAGRSGPGSVLVQPCDAAEITP